MEVVRANLAKFFNAEDAEVRRENKKLTLPFSAFFASSALRIRSEIRIHSCPFVVNSPAWK